MALRDRTIQAECCVRWSAPPIADVNRLADPLNSDNVLVYQLSGRCSFTRRSLVSLFPKGSLSVRKLHADQTEIIPGDAANRRQWSLNPRRQAVIYSPAALSLFPQFNAATLAATPGRLCEPNQDRFAHPLEAGRRRLREKTFLPTHQERLEPVANLGLFRSTRMRCMGCHRKWGLL